MAKSCTNCPGATDHDTAHCPLRAINYGAKEEREAFEREERYVVIKISKMHPHPTFRRRHLEALKREHSAALVDCVVIERDWPEYETVWRMIEERVTGAALAQPSPKSGSYSDQEWINAGCSAGQPEPEPEPHVNKNPKPPQGR